MDVFDDQGGSTRKVIHALLVHASPAHQLTHQVVRRYDPITMTGNALMRVGNRFETGGPMVGTKTVCTHTKLVTSMEVHRWRNQQMQMFDVIVKVLPSGQAVKFGVLETYPIDYIYFQFRTLAGDGTRSRAATCVRAANGDHTSGMPVPHHVQRVRMRRWSCCFPQRWVRFT